MLYLRLLFRSQYQPAYRQNIRERFGYGPVKFEKCLWVHTVSMGEAIAASPLIRALITHYPTLPIVVTTMTPTGRARVKTMLGDTVTTLYLPYDLPCFIKKFIDAIHPIAGIIMETELWPNLLNTCQNTAIPVCLINARLSEKSMRGYQRIQPLTRNMLQQIDQIAAGSKADAKRLIALGANKERIIVTGNIKFDLQINDATITQGERLRQPLGNETFVWIAASTHSGEDEIILAAHKKLLALHSKSCLILVPRHPDRFESVFALCEKEFTTTRRSKNIPITANTQVLLGDTMGELLSMYMAADVAFVGGSLIPHGGHNFIEPAALSKPILTGPHIFNFADVGQRLAAQHALLFVKDAETLFATLQQLQTHPDEQKQMGARALAVANENRGALEKQLGMVYQIVERADHQTANA